MKVVQNEVTGNMEAIVTSVITSISEQPTITNEKTGKRSYSVICDLNIDGNIQKDVRALMSEGNFERAKNNKEEGKGMNVSELIEGQVSVQTRLIKTDANRPPLVVVSHLTGGNQVDDSFIAWDDVTVEEPAQA